jgi:hypothetical protein
VVAAGIVSAAPVYHVVLTIASVEPLVSDLFSVTLTPGTAGVRSVFGHPDSSRPCVSCARRSDDTDAFLNSARQVQVSCLECVFRVHVSVVTQTDHDSQGDSATEYQQSCSKLGEAVSIILPAHSRRAGVRSG